MLEFPSYSFGGFFLLFIIVAISISVFAFTVHEWVTVTKNKKKIPILVILTIVSPIFLYASHCTTRMLITEPYLFRNIPVSKVSAIEMSYNEAEYNDLTIKTRIDDPNAIQEGLRTLKNCQATTNLKRRYENSYKIRLIFEDESLNNAEFFISVYRDSYRDDGNLVIAPHLSENHYESFGTFYCGEFQNWLRRNISPPFENKEDLSF